MKKFLLLLLTFFCLQNLLRAQDASPYFTSYPALTPGCNGVSPDIYVKNTFEERMHDKDPQIEKAVEEIMKELK